MSDDQIDRAATVFLSAYGLPSDRLIHLQNEMKALRFFSLHGDTQNYNVITDLRHYHSQRTKFASASIFIIVSKSTGIESNPSADLETLTREFGALRKL